MEKKPEVLADILDRIITLTHACDTKTSVIIGGMGVIMSILLSPDNLQAIRELFERMNQSWQGYKTITSIVCYISSLLVVVGGFFFVHVLISRTTKKYPEKKQTNEEKLNRVFFKDIAKFKSAESYWNIFYFKEEEQPTELEKDYFEEIYLCSRICSKKYALYKIGLILSSIGIFLFGAYVIYGMIM